MTGGPVALRLSTQREGDEVTLAARGVVDLASAKELEDGLAAVVADDRATVVVVDLAGVTLLDSMGIAALLKGRRLADERGRTYRLTGASGIVRQVLDITGVWTHLGGV
jgi:anti-sigma B factor antagonist